MTSYVKRVGNLTDPENFENAVKDLTVSLLFLAHLFGVSGVSVTITRGDSDE